MKKPLRIFTQVFVTCAISQFALEAGEGMLKEGKVMAIGSGYDVCDVNRIYNEDYKYSLDKTILESFLSGKAFDNKEVYSEKEAANLRTDIQVLYQNILSKNPLNEPVAIITAGAPGAGKTIKLHQDREENAIKGKNYAYVCPDDVCLRNQTITYKAEIEKGDGSKEAHEAAYNKWRPGSNAATHLILGNLIREKYAFYFGTTSSSPGTGKFFDFLKKQGYQIKLIHVTAPDDVRWASIQERDKTFVQTTKEDIMEKGKLLPQRINDTFLAYADEIEFYYRGAVKQDAQLVARWIRNTPPSEKLGTLHITDNSQYEKIRAIHDAATVTLNRPDLCWDATVEKNSKVLAKF